MEEEAFWSLTRENCGDVGENGGEEGDIDKDPEFVEFDVMAEFPDLAFVLDRFLRFRPEIVFVFNRCFDLDVDLVLDWAYSESVPCSE